MKGDFTRDTFDASKHFSRLLMQQGRVQLDADWNEQISILLHYLQMLAADLIGPHGGPENILGNDDQLLRVNCGFEIITTENRIDELPESDEEKKRLKEILKQSNPPLLIGRGHYYVDGVLCESPEYIAYSDQKDYPLPDRPTQFTAGQSYLIYLDVWERHITHLEDNYIREAALGEPDTATRAKVVWQVKSMRATDCEEVSNLKSLSSARMRAGLKPEDLSSDPCIVAPNSKYRGAENQLYRVEIHEGSTDENGNTQPWTFKWSRDNGSIAAIWLGNNEDGGLIVSNTYGFAEGEWIEITRETDELNNKPGKLVKIVKVEGGALYLESHPAWDKDELMKVRRWDQSEVGDVSLIEGAVKGVAGQWLDLENGVQVYFEAGGEYRSGDYWLIPARVATGQIEWPLELDANGNVVKDAKGDEIRKALKPRGVEHRYAPLAMLTWSGSVLSIDQDCRCSFKLTMSCPPPTTSEG